MSSRKYYEELSNNSIRLYGNSPSFQISLSHSRMIFASQWRPSRSIPRSHPRNIDGTTHRCCSRKSSFIVLRTELGAAISALRGHYLEKVHVWATLASSWSNAQQTSIITDQSQVRCEGLISGEKFSKVVIEGKSVCFQNLPNDLHTKIGTWFVSLFMVCLRQYFFYAFPVGFSTWEATGLQCLYEIVCRMLLQVRDTIVVCNPIGFTGDEHALDLVPSSQSFDLFVVVGLGINEFQGEFEIIRAANKGFYLPFRCFLRK